MINNELMKLLLSLSAEDYCYLTTQGRVYAVWLPMLAGDAREEWNGISMPDARVTHFWDGELQVGQWSAKNVDGYNGVAWDIYYLYGPDAVWETVPYPPAGSGQTIYGERQQLQMKVYVVGKVICPTVITTF